jgi:ATP-binding cassette subfamily F protein 3
MAKENIYSNTDTEKNIAATWGESVLSFQDLTFYYNENKPILKEASSNIRKGQKLTLMGPNGAGKSTLFSIITGEQKPIEGRVVIGNDLKIALAKQFIPHDKWEKTVREFLEEAFTEKVYDIDKKAEETFAVINLHPIHKTKDIKTKKDEAMHLLNKKIKELSGGQKGKLLIAQALIAKPDILLLDEPTNNLDKEAVKLLTNFMKTYTGTAIVISHDENFLNSFTHGILYINTQNQKLEQYVGNYFKAIEEIKRQIEREKREVAQAEKKIQENKDKVNFFAHKGGKMRKLAAKLKDEYKEMEENMTDERKEDKTIRKFNIKINEEERDRMGGVIIEMDEVNILEHGEPKDVKIKKIELRKGDKLQILGPNGIGKTTLLERIANKKAIGTKIKENINIGYYRQDFTTLDFSKSAYEELSRVFKRLDDHHLRATAAGFLLGGKELSHKVGHLSEGQKGLLMFAYLTLLEPGILILDEPTNHINFRHIPVIAEAIKNYEGVVIIVSHVNDFVRKIGVNHTLDLGSI